MKKDTRRKISWIAFLLAAWMTVSAIPATALGSFGEGIALAPEQESAALEDEVLGSDEALTVEETELSLLPALGEGEKTVAELSAMEVNAADIPEVIPMSRAQEKGLVNRLRAQEESLSTLVYQTKSGNKTAYVYSRPVKYVAADGSIRDKSTAVSALTNATYAYAMEDNSVKAYFPKSITGGVLLAYNDYRITMTPEVTGDYTPLYNEEEKAVVYAGVFGEATFLTYKPQMYGLKEDVILAKNPGVNRFDFVMTTQGLTAQKGADGIWRLYNSQNEAVAGLGQVIVKDSAGKTAMGELEVTLLSVNRYRVSVVAPQEFLNASDTFYPVYVDPTTTVYEEENREYQDENGFATDADFDTIIDVGLYESQVGYTSALADTETHYLGYKNGGYGKVIYKFYDFYGEHGYFTDLYAEQIGKVTLHIYAYDGDGIDLIASPMTATWNTQTNGENPIALLNSTGSNLWNSYHSASSVSYSIPEADGWYGLDITSIVQGWARYNAGESTASYHNPQNGFALSTGTTSYYMGIYSVESNEFAVCYEVDYSVYGGTNYIYQVNGSSATYVTRYYDGEEYYVEPHSYTTNSNYELRWDFIYAGEDSSGNETYYIKCKNHAFYLICYGDYIDLGTMTANNINKCTWKLIPAVGGYYLQSVYNGYYLYLNGTSVAVAPNMLGNAAAQWWVSQSSDLVLPDAINITSPNWVGVGESVRAHILATSPNEVSLTNQLFVWESSNTDVAEVSSSGIITGVSNGYATISATHMITEATSSLVVTIGQVVENGFYYIMNKEAGMFLEVEDGSRLENGNIQVGSLQDYAYEEWAIVYAGNGSYVFQSGDLWSFKFLSYSSDNSAVQKSNSVQEGITLEEVDEILKWKILKCESGAYKIVPARANNYALAIPSSTNTEGLNCVISNTLGTGDNHGEWYLSYCNRRVDMTVLMDDGYIQGYLDYSDYNRDTIAADRVERAMFAVREKYAQYYSICINYSAPTPASSYADECSTDNYGFDGHDYEDQCRCCNDSQCVSANIRQPTDNLHHKNLSNVLANVRHPSESEDVVLLFTGHILCKQEGTSHTNNLGSVSGKANRDDCTILVCDTTRGNDDSVCFTIMHEIGHLFRIDDHYNSGQTEQFNQEAGSNIYNDNCAYGFNKDSLGHDNYVLCQACQDKLYQNIERFETEQG